MFNIDLKAVRHGAVAALGTLVLTTTAITAAVGPAMAVDTAPAAYAQTAVADGASA